MEIHRAVHAPTLKPVLCLLTLSRQRSMKLCGVMSKTHDALVSISCFLAMGQRAATVLELKPSPFNPICLLEVEAHRILHHHNVQPNTGTIVFCLLSFCFVSQFHLLPIAASTISLEYG